MTDEADVFLSYSRDEVPFVRAVADALEQRGLVVWFDETRIEPGTNWYESLSESLGSAKAVIVFVSTKGLQSSWTNFEIGAAVGRQKRLVPVYLTEAARQEAPPLIADRAGIDAYHLKPEEVAEQIADAVKAA